MNARQSHTLRFDRTTPWAATLRLADVVRCMDDISDDTLNTLLEHNAGGVDGVWEMLHAARALLAAEGLRP